MTRGPFRYWSGLEQGWRIEDAEILCQLDKEKRGKVWLAFGPIIDAEEPAKRKANG